MSFLIVLCEGVAEMYFVQQVLGPHLREYSVTTQEIMLGKRVRHDIASAPGGVLSFVPVYRHITSELRRCSSPTSFVTTMLDFYAFPNDFPAYDDHVKIANPRDRVEAFERALLQEVGKERFVPYIQLHEFEALILTRPEELREEFDDDSDLKGVDDLITDIGDLRPEEVNQTSQGAPSKRILRHLPNYRKTTMGPRITERIGITRLRGSCPHFGAWVSQLERLGQAN
jgi:hypothetical protein